MGGWEARGWLYLPIGLFGVAMRPRNTYHRPREVCLESLRDNKVKGEYQTHTSHLVPFMGPIVSVVISHGWQNPF